MNYELRTAIGEQTMHPDWSLPRYAATIIGILIVAALLRFVGIGTWSFASDELGTFNEVAAFLDPPESADHPDAKVPQMIPVGMLIHHAGHVLFGRDEAGCRTMMAVCGLLQIALLGIGLPGLVGRFNAHLVCVLLAIAPEHLFYCQYHRFYAPAGLFVTATFIAGWYALRRESFVWGLVAVACSWLAVLTQTLTGSIVGMLVVAWFVGQRELRLRSKLIVLSIANAVAVLVFAVVYLYPLGKGKAIGYAWVGDSVPQAVLSAVTQLSFPVALLAGPGLLLMWQQDRAACRYVAAFALAWAGTMLVFPKLIPFHSAYLFPLNVPCFIFAGVAIGEATQRVMRGSPFAGFVLSGALLFLNLPSLVSYYQDGNRHDFRKAATLALEKRVPGDVLVFVQGDKFEYYRPELRGQWHRLPPKDFATWADNQVPAAGKVWIIVPGGRSGVPSPWKEWLQQRGRLRATVTQRHFDYHEYPIFFFTLEPPD